MLNCDLCKEVIGEEETDYLSIKLTPASDAVMIHGRCGRNAVKDQKQPSYDEIRQRVTDAHARLAQSPELLIGEWIRFESWLDRQCPFCDYGSFDVLLSIWSTGDRGGYSCQLCFWVLLDLPDASGNWSMEDVGNFYRGIDVKQCDDC